jgi:hypothetical protein
VTLQEAIKTGKRFKRKGYPWFPNDGWMKLSCHDILATDWITEEPERKVKRITVWRPIFQIKCEGDPGLVYETSTILATNKERWRKRIERDSIVGWESKEIEVEDSGEWLANN